MSDINLTANRPEEMIESTGHKQTIEVRHAAAIEQCRNQITYWQKLLKMLEGKKE